MKLTFMEPSDIQSELIAIHPKALNTKMLQLTVCGSLSQFIYQSIDVNCVITGITGSQHLKDNLIEMTAAPAPDIFNLVQLTICAIKVVGIISLLRLFLGEVEVGVNVIAQTCMVKTPDFHGLALLKIELTDRTYRPITVCVPITFINQLATFRTYEETLFHVYLSTINFLTIHSRSQPTQHYNTSLSQV
jgi:hypothetical protein